MRNRVVSFVPSIVSFVNLWVKISVHDEHEEGTNDTTQEDISIQHLTFEQVTTKGYYERFGIYYSCN